MDVREKLVELLHKGVRCPGVIDNCNDCPYYSFEKACDEFGATVDLLIANGVTVQEWISVKDRLPEENEYVMIWCGECQIARIEKGISEEQRNAMKRGELDDPCETGWTLSSGYVTLKRSQSYKACDEQGNKRVPYCWYANGGPMKWFGQEVTHWAYLPQPPKGE